MSKPLDDQRLVEKLDPNQSLQSVSLLGDQISQAWQAFKKVRIPDSYKSIDKILVNGMGGSQLGAHMLQSLYFDRLRKPFQIINGYDLPGYLDPRTLYIISSYSGDTEEPISTVTAAQKRGAKVFGIASGGKLGRLINQGKLPGFVFDPVANPSRQPRLGLGYSLTAQLALLQRLELVQVTDQDIKAQLRNLEKFRKQFDFSQPTSTNPAKKLAEAAFGKALAVVASEHLAGNAHVFANQANENSKTFSAYYVIPELNHHLLEGLKNPAANQTKLLFIFFESKLYHPKNQQRHQITQQVVTRNKVKLWRYQLRSADGLGQALEALALSSYATFYLALLNNLNPNLIPWVNYFKAELKKRR